MKPCFFWIFPLVLALLIASVSLGEEFAIKVNSDKQEFTLIIIPDTQRYALFFPDIFYAQTRWIRDHHKALNTRFVIHVGDVVDERSDKEWAVADRAFTDLDGEVPYLVVPGNHDLEKGPDGKLIRQSTKFNAVFSPYRFKGYSWYGGHKGVTSDNSFGYFEAGGRKFMVVGLEYGPSDATLDWADLLIDNHKDQHQVILVTHAYLYEDDTRLGEGDQWSPKKSNPHWNDGEGIWDKLVRRQDNIFMVLCGHVKGDGTGLLISRSDDDTRVIQMLANYQFLEHGGLGWLRILWFKPDQGVLEVHTYSPWLDEFRNEHDQRFDLDIRHLFPERKSVSERRN